MFFPELITSIRESDKVLEIGPGSDPHPRSDVLLEKNFPNEKIAEAQRGFSPALRTEKKIVFYDGGKLPFQDNEFDYVICSHVLEHVERADLDIFLGELQRIAARGYLEFPNVFYELINYQEVHVWFMNYRDGGILLMDKKRFKSNYIHKSYREMFLCPDQYMWKAIDRYKKFFFIGFEWNRTIPYRIADHFDELISHEDHERAASYFKTFKPEPLDGSPIQKYGAALRQIKKLITDRFKKPYSVHRTAQLEDRRFIVIHPYAEIKDYVIIRAFTNPVVIGKYTQINPYTVIYGHNSIIIGDNVMIAPHCMIASGNHDFKQINVPMRFAGNLTKGPIVIEDNVWIGANATITDGVRIGRDAVIAANSVVVSDVEPYAIVGGVPAKVMGSRITKER